MQDLAAYFSSIANETVAAGGTETAGIETAATCIACHGQNGISISPNWPTLAGQYEDYLRHALDQYRDGTRKNPVMAQMAAPLTDKDVNVLARYYSGLEGLETTVVE
jgi:cytochrome c553